MNAYYSVGEDTLSKYDLESLPDIEYIVYDYYWLGGYEADGKAVIKSLDGKFYVVGLGHCSCYGPLYGIQLNNEIPFEELINTDSIHSLAASLPSSVITRVRELEGLE